jgi:prepilin-type processing-associated H-X9-DG protein
MPEHRSRFRLIDLIVVIGIIALVLGAIIPAIQRVREPARRLSCAKNLKQLGFGAQTYHDGHLHFPPGRLIPNAIPTNGAGAILHDYFQTAPEDCTGFLLMFRDIAMVDQPSPLQRIHTTRSPPTSVAPQGWYYFPGIDPSLTTDPTEFTYRYVIQEKLWPFTCPSNRSEPGTVNITAPWIALSFPPSNAPFPGATDYAMCKGTNAFLDRSPWSGGSDANGIEQAIPKRARGIFDTNSKTRKADITDGLSNTFLFGEVAGNTRRYLARANFTDASPALDSNGRPIKIDQAWGVPVIPNAAVALGAKAFFGSYLAVTAQFGGYDTSGTAPGNPIDGPEPLNAPLVMASIDWSGTSFPSKDPPNTFNNPALLAKGMHLDTLNGFRSMHPGGANFCFADGSVRFISTSISQYTYEAMSTYQGGEVMESLIHAEPSQDNQHEPRKVTNTGHHSITFLTY